MKYTKKVGLAILFMVMGMWGCDSYFDINKNPNFPPSVDSKFVLSSTQLDIAVAVGGEAFNVGGFFSQYWTQALTANQYPDIDKYSITENLLNRTSTNLYSGLSNLKVIRREGEKKENWAVNLVCVTLEVYSWQLLVDLFDKTPYEEALQPRNDDGTTGILQPKFDDGEQIYSSIIEKLNDALSKDFKGDNSTLATFKIEKADLLLDSDVDKWKSFAKSLLLKLHMRRAFTSRYDLGAVDDLISNTKIPFINEDIKFDHFEKANNKRNPWVDTRDRLGKINHIASKTLANYLVKYSDPRLEKIYKKAEDSKDYNANWQGDHGFLRGAAAKIDNFATPNIDDDNHPVYLLTKSEVSFFLAEVEAKKGNYAGAKTYYERGIIESLNLHNITGSNDIATTGIYSWDTWEGGTPTDFESALKKIALQKWIALATVNHIEAFFELNRTGYPEKNTSYNPENNRQASFDGGQLILSVTGRLGVLNNQFPRRFFYPQNEVTRNDNSPAQPSSIAEKIWWDKK